MFMSYCASLGTSGTTFSSLPAAISAALAYAVGLESSDIRVTTVGGILCLDGVVPDVRAMELALDIVRDIGTCAVLNRMTLTSDETAVAGFRLHA